MNDMRSAVVPVGGTEILTLKVGDEIYVPMRPVAEALGINWSNELRRINADPILMKAVVKLTTAFISGQEMVCLPLTHFHGWSFKLNLNTVNEVARPLLEAVQTESYTALHDYWTKGVAVNPRAVAQLEQSERSTAYRELPRIMEKLLVARNRQQRRVLEAMAGQLSATLGIEPPAPDTIGSADPDVGDRIAPFFKALAMLDAAGVDYNHSRQPELIAVNLNELGRLFVTHHQGVTIDRQLKADLQFATRPRFVRMTTVNSRLSRGSRQCYVFARDATPQLG